MGNVIEQSVKHARKGLRLIALTALVAALIVWLLSTLSFSTFKQLAAEFSGHHQANRVTEPFYTRLKADFRISSLALAGLGAGLLLLERRLACIASQFWMAFAQECRSAWWSLRKIMTMAIASRYQVIFFAVILGSAIALRAIYLNQPMRYDEAYTFLMYARKGLLRTISLDYTPNNHLFHTELVWLFTRFFGSSPPVLRLPTLLAGILLVVIVYVDGVRRGSVSAGLCAAALIATNADLIMYSTNSRGYTIQAVLFFAQFQIASALSVAPRRIGLWTPFVALTAASLYTNPSMVYGVAACTMVVVIGFWRTSELWLAQGSRLGGALLMAALITATLYTPVIVGSGYRSLFANPYVRATAWDGLPSRIADSLIETWQTWNLGWPAPLVFVLVAGFLACIIWENKYRPLLGSLAICAILVVVQRVAPPPRVWLFFLPLYLVIASEGIVGTLRRFGGTHAEALARLAAVFLLIVGAMSVVHSGVVPSMPETGVNPDAALVASRLKSELRAGDQMIATLPVSLPVMYYGFRLGLSEEYWTTSDPIRILVVMDKKPGRELSADEFRVELDQAFSQSYTTARPEQFQIAGVIYEADNAQIVSLQKKLYSSTAPSRDKPTQEAVNGPGRKLRNPQFITIHHI
jgi:hypothetical protein